MTTERIAQDCDHFSLPPPAFSGIDEVKADISAFVSSCGLYEEYATKLGELGGEDWISFRGRLYVFEDFVIEWLEKARAAPAGAVADFLKSELAKFRDVAPLLKYVRGEPFQQEHWAALFRKLSIEKVDLAKLTLGHFLAAGQALIDGAEEVKTLNARATGEIAIREAIGEVSSWAAETSFSLTKHADASGREVALIRDWKDLTTQVSDLQALLGSLKESPFFGGFADRVADFEKKLATLDQVGAPPAHLPPVLPAPPHLARLTPPAPPSSHSSTSCWRSSTRSSASGCTSSRSSGAARCPTSRRASDASTTSSAHS